MNEADSGTIQTADSTSSHKGCKCANVPVINKYSLRDLLTVIFCDRRIIITAFSIVFFLFAFASLFFPTTYSPSARLLVLMSREYTLGPELGGASAMMSIGQNQIVRTEMEILTNPMLIEEVIENLGIDEIYPRMGWATKDPGWGALVVRRFLEVWHGWRRHLESPLDRKTREKLRMAAAVKRFISNLAVEPIKETSVVQLKFSHTNPEMASDALNALVYFYLDRRQGVLNQKRSPLMMAQRESFRERLFQASKELDIFKSNHGISSFEDQKSLLLRQQMEIKSNQIDTENRLAEAVARFNSLRKALAATPVDVQQYAETSKHDARDTMRDMLLTLEVRQREMRTKFHDNNRFVTDLTEQIESVREMMRQTQPKELSTQRVGRNSSYDQIWPEYVRAEAEVASLRERRNQIAEDLKQSSKKLQEFGALEQEYAQLLRTRDLMEQNLKTYSQKVEETQILEEMDRQKSANVRSIEQATPPAMGSNPVTLILSFGLFAGIFVGLIAGIVRDSTRGTLISPESAERALGLPVLIAIPLKRSSR